MFDPGAVVSTQLLLIHKMSHPKDSNWKAVTTLIPVLGYHSVQSIVKLFPFGDSSFVALTRVKSFLYVGMYGTSESNTSIVRQKASCEASQIKQSNTGIPL